MILHCLVSMRLSLRGWLSLKIQRRASLSFPSRRPDAQSLPFDHFIAVYIFIRSNEFWNEDKNISFQRIHLYNAIWILSASLKSINVLLNMTKCTLIRRKHHFGNTATYDIVNKHIACIWVKHFMNIWFTHQYATFLWSHVVNVYIWEKRTVNVLGRIRNSSRCASTDVWHRCSHYLTQPTGGKFVCRCEYGYGLWDREVIRIYTWA